MLECVVNVSEGRDADLVGRLGVAAGQCLLDVHRDVDHNRSVFTLAGPHEALAESVRSRAHATVAHLDLRLHRGVHPRIGVLDVVPFVALKPGDPDGALVDGDTETAIGARNRFARWAGDTLALPCFLYGPERTLPQLRRHAWHDMAPDTGPPAPHPSAGAAAVGARGVLVAYNLWLDGDGLGGADLVVARQIAKDLRGPAVRTLGLAVGGGAQVSCNLIAPGEVGPADVFDAVARRAAVARAELVGLLPRRALLAIPRHRWDELGVGPASTIEARLEEAGLDGGRFASGC